MNRTKILIAGLGNPGQEYDNTWHNFGFLTIDEFQRQNGFPDFIVSQKFHALISEKILDDKKITLFKPQTFMNESGKSVKSLLTNHHNKIAMAMLLRGFIVIHDDVDLPKGKIRISKDKGTAGHKGIDSIIKTLKSKNFGRIRIGVRPTDYVPGSRSLNQFVLKKFTKNERKIVAKAIKDANEAIKMILEEGIDKAMNKYNSR